MTYASIEYIRYGISMKKIMGNSLDLELSFKGSRNYITGADFFSEITRTIRAEIAECLWISNAKFRDFALCGCSLSWSKSDIVDEELLCGECKIQTPEGVVNAYLIKNHSKIINRLAYDESKIIGKIDIEKCGITRLESSGYTMIDEIVSLTKQLHNKLYPLDNGQWAFIQLDLNTELIDSSSTLSMNVIKVIKGKFSVSNIIVDGTEVGTLRFSVVVR